MNQAEKTRFLPAQVIAPRQISEPDPLRIVLIVPRGEAVRNFLYSDTLPLLAQQARVTLLSVVDDERFVGRFRPYAKQIIGLRSYPEHRLVLTLRYLAHNAHFRWLWSGVAQNTWEWRDAEASTRFSTRARRLAWKAVMRLLANRPTLEVLTAAEQQASWTLRPNDDYIHLFRQLKPDLVFNCSHIHGEAGELPAKIAHHMGIPTAGFIFSWDNLTSRSRIFVPYDHYLVWHEPMRRQLLNIYPRISPDRVIVTGTPQFDFHLNPELCQSRDEFCRRIGVDPSRPYVLYTTGVAHHFPEEHRTVELVIRLLHQLPIESRPQLVVRTYIKDTSQEMKALGERGIPDVIFPPVLWEEKWATPLYDDLIIYSNLLRHAALGINAASTVSLELMLLDKPVINLGFDPPGSTLPHHLRWMRHIEFDHYRPVAESGGVMVARAPEDMAGLLLRGLREPDADSPKRQTYMREVFGNTLDGRSGQRVAETLVRLAAGS